MVDSNALKQLRTALQPYALLYVEDNVGLNTQATLLFRKIFQNVYIAYDGEEGLAIFKEYRPSIVITDITMPKMDGLAMSEAIKQIDPDVKVIVTTAHDDHELLHKAIRVGVLDYLAKPMRIESLIETLFRCAHLLKEELHSKIFNANLHSIFNYQNSLTLLLNDQKVVMANQPCLDFFAAVSVEALRQKFVSFGEMLLQHNSFLYNREGYDWFAQISNNPGKLFNVKMAGSDGDHHHFILRFQSIPEKDGYGVLSLNDVTELGLLKLYDASAVDQERLAKDEKVVRALLDMAMRNAAKIKVHNLYKGLSITNDGLVAEVDEKESKLKTSYVQLKAMQLEEMFYLTSELFPMAIAVEGIKKIDFDEQSVVFEHYRLVQTSPTRRDAIRVVPDQEMRVTVLYEGRKFDANLQILDVSIRGIRVEFPSLPSGFALKQSVVLDIVMMMAQRPVIVNTEAEVFRIVEGSRRYEVVFLYDLNTHAQKNLIDYIAKRQMILIREFKGIQYEK